MRAHHPADLMVLRHSRQELSPYRAAIGARTGGTDHGRGPAWLSDVGACPGGSYFADRRPLRAAARCARLGLLRDPSPYCRRTDDPGWVCRTNHRGIHGPGGVSGRYRRVGITASYSARPAHYLRPVSHPGEKASELGALQRQTTGDIRTSTARVAGPTAAGPAGRGALTVSSL